MKIIYRQYSFDAADVEKQYQKFIARKGYSGECPNKSRHTSTSTKKDFHTSLGPMLSQGFQPIFFHCRHTSCIDANASLCRTVNQEWGKYLHRNATKLYDKEIIPVDSEYESRMNIMRKMQAEMKRKQEDEFKEWCKEIFEEKKMPTFALPDPIYPSPTDDWDTFLSLWESNDLIYVGNKDGPTAHAIFSIEFLRSVDHNDICDHCFTSGNTMKDVNGRRSGDNTKEQKYIVLEHDALDKTAQYNQLHWFSQFYPLLMVVDSGGKSLHGWFRNFPVEDRDYIKAVMCKNHRISGLGYDPATFGVILPVRCPGAYREEKKEWQRILYFNPTPQLGTGKDGMEYTFGKYRLTPVL